MLTTCLRCHYPTTIGVTSNSIDPKSDSAWDRAYRGLTSLPPLLLCVCVCERVYVHKNVPEKVYDSVCCE